MGDLSDIETIENRYNITLSKDQFISLEGARVKGYRLFAIPRGGEPIRFVQYQGQFYLAKPTTKAYEKPIPFLEVRK
jgi:hypothetical protein